MRYKPSDVFKSIMLMLSNAINNNTKYVYFNMVHYYFCRKIVHILTNAKDISNDRECVVGFG